jgi:colanic acid biosynthesis glycosyl transferase WcaI
MGELALELRGFGHEISVLTTSPHYNRDEEAEARQVLKTYLGPILWRSNFNGIPVYHVSMPKKGPTILARILPLFSFHVLSLSAGIFLVPRKSVLIVPSPPLTLGIIAWLLCLLRKGKYIYNVQEVYPDCAISLGAIHNKQLIQLLYRIESLVYAKARSITVIAPHMIEQLKEKGVPASKIKLVPNFADINELRPLPKENDFSRQHRMHDKFVVSYAGNMGPTQELKTFIDCAALLRDQSDIRFVMMGDGMLRDRLYSRVRGLGLPNFIFLPYQPYSLVPEIYAASDLCLVPQSRNITDVAIPSKVYRIMACARPVLAATLPGSDLALLIQDARCGLIVEPGSPHGLAESVLKAFENREALRAMGEAGRLHVEKYYSLQAVAKEYHDLVEEIGLGTID